VNHRAMNQPDDPEHPLPEFDAGDFLDALAGVARTPPMLCALRSMREHLSKPTWPGLVWAFSSLQRDDMPADEPPLAVSEDMCDPTFCRSWFQIHSAVAVSCSLWAFLSSASRPADASCAVADIAAIAVDLGGDADTVGSMAGALAGALHGAGRPNADGYEHIPPAWWHQIENGTYGRDFIVDTARGLADLELREPSVAIPVANRVAEALASSGGGLSQAEQQDLHLAARRAYQPIEAQQSLKLYREQHAREALPVDDPPEPAASL